MDSTQFAELCRAAEHVDAAGRAAKAASELDRCLAAAGEGYAAHLARTPRFVAHHLPGARPGARLRPELPDDRFGGMPCAASGASGWRGGTNQHVRWPCAVRTVVGCEEDDAPCAESRRALAGIPQASRMSFLVSLRVRAGWMSRR